MCDSANIKRHVTSPLHVIMLLTARSTRTLALKVYDSMFMHIKGHSVAMNTVFIESGSNLRHV